MYHSIAILQKLEDASENMVGGPVGAASFPPAFNDAPVVSVDHNVIAFAR